MTTTNQILTDYDPILDREFGKAGTQKRIKSLEKARAFCAAQMLAEARAKAKISQTELAKRVGTTRDYISKVENGEIEPSVGMYFSLISALGYGIEIVP
ncbi:MAG: helix-turn-helix domain-containing protein [Salinivirgaceae bacterium]|jgi:DNA-binding XRE family transcriptional regulator|nr:helix-turn-helix transcriptional regulator [Bacteroidales bacterium]